MTQPADSNELPYSAGIPAGGIRGDLSPVAHPASPDVPAGSYHPGANPAFNTGDRLAVEMRRRICAAGEFQREKFPHPWNPPAFRSCRQLARTLIEAFPLIHDWLVMRDSCLRPLREELLKAGRTLIVPARYGHSVWRIPPSALRADGVLVIDPMPKQGTPYSGNVDMLVVGCMGFHPAARRLYGLDPERTASLLERLREGLENGFRLSSSTPTVCLAADCQQVADWPESALGYVTAHFVATPTRFITLGSGGVQGWLEESDGTQTGEFS